MALDRELLDPALAGQSQARLVSFSLKGLFGGHDIELAFPGPHDEEAEATILILSGQNGAGKTTVFKMIDGMLKLDFDMFRQVPFTSCSLTLSTGETLFVRSIKDKTFPLEVEFGEHKVKLLRNRTAGRYNPEHDRAIGLFRSFALPIVRSVEYRFLPVDRSSYQRDREKIIERGRDHQAKYVASLSEQVARFLSVAQIDYRRFFRDEELGVIPRLLHRMQGPQLTKSRDELLSRIDNLKKKQPLMIRYGLHFDYDVINAIESLITQDNEFGDSQLILLETYVEMQEGAQRAKDLITRRLQEFDNIMADFLFEKAIRIDAAKGLSIVSSAGQDLSEEDLSSGEYHFLYMMVAALLCQRTGSVIAIDEPELSLHVKWQRKLVSALARCASGASPLFLFATHSVAISAQHADRLVELSPVD